MDDIEYATCWSPECDGQRRIVVVDERAGHREKCFTCRRWFDDYEAPVLDPRAVVEIAPEDMTLWAEAAYDVMPDPVPLAEVEGRTQRRRLSKSERRRARRAAQLRGEVRGHK